MKKKVNHLIKMQMPPKQPSQPQEKRESRPEQGDLDIT